MVGVVDRGATKPGYLYGECNGGWNPAWDLYLLPALTLPKTVSVAVVAVAGWKAERAFEGDKILFLKAKAPREGRGFMRIEQKHMLKALAVQ